MKSGNKPIKLPKVLVCIGQCNEIKTDDGVYNFRIKDKVMLFSTTNGKTLYCMAYKALKTSNDEFKTRVQSNQSQVSTGMNLYEKWHEFEPVSGSVCKPPKGFLFDAGRCVHIIYTSDKWVGKKRKYIHTFKSKPKCWVNKKSTAPTLLALTGGKIRVRKDGITG